MISFHGSRAYLTITTILLSYGSRVVLARDFDAWLVLSGDFRNPPGPDDVRIVACSERRGETCGGRCYGYQGRPGDTCTPIPDRSAVNCLAATKPVRMCFRTTCERQCNDYVSCGVPLRHGFCFTPDTHSIQFFASNTNITQPEATTIQGPPPAPASSSAPATATSSASASSPPSSSQATSSVNAGPVASSDTNEDTTKLGAIPTSASSSTEQVTAGVPTPLFSTATRPSSSTSATGVAGGNGSGTDANGNPIEQAGSTSKVGTGAIVGIIFGALGIIIGAILIFVWLKRRQKNNDSTSFNPLLMGKSIPLIGVSPAPGQTPTPLPHSRSTWYSTAKFPNFGYQKSIPSRSGSPEYGFADDRSGALMSEKGTWR
ncbi:hypothetical protein BKA70DRAFT_1330710 [Coprinopsis sp. MPI-PUGE-AT-0042]|nr:hypothetical protein BKA70DRAFT_1330710 [Coprinopsis sp. MPI-PUGE-AT-0042]